METKSHVQYIASKWSSLWTNQIKSRKFVIQAFNYRQFSFCHHYTTLQLLYRPQYEKLSLSAMLDIHHDKEIFQ